MSKATFFLSAVMLVSLAACDSSSGGNTSDASANSQSTAASTTSDASPSGNSASDNHNYAMQDGDSYGYEPGVSRGDQDNGKGVSSLIMYKYLGNANGVYTIEPVDGSGRMSCSNPCKFMKITPTGDEGDAQIMPFDPATIGSSAMQDAIGGKLQVAKNVGATTSDNSQSDGSN